MIQIIQVDNLPPPYMGSTCVVTNPEKNSSFVNPLQHFDHYSFSACKLNCLIEYVYHKCGCKIFFHNGKNRCLAAIKPICGLVQPREFIIIRLSQIYTFFKINAACFTKSVCTNLV